MRSALPPDSSSVGEHFVKGAVLLSEGPQLVELIFGVLALGLRRYPGIDDYSHV